eukprot:6211116-Pleurochrysis_carterae.AAC.2
MQAQQNYFDNRCQHGLCCDREGLDTMSVFDKLEHAVCHLLRFTGTLEAHQGWRLRAKSLFFDRRSEQVILAP